MYDVITLGSATIDVFAVTASELLTIREGRHQEKHICYPSGEKIVIQELDFLTGGSGLNAAVSFARLGLSAAYLGNLGRDENGERILDELDNENVDFIGTRSKEKTNYSIILNSMEHDRTILTHHGASDVLTKTAMPKTRWLYTSSLLGASYRTALIILAKAKKRKVRTAANISMYLAKRKVRYLQPLLRNLDVLIFNKEEAQAMLGSKSEDVVYLLAKARTFGPEIIVITDGARGASAYDGDHVYHIAASKMKVRESTGAGDAFASGFVAALAKKKSLADALRYGLANAESCIMHTGAKQGLLSWRNATKKVKAYKRKVSIQ